MGLPHNLSGIYQTIQVGVQPRKEVITHSAGLLHLKETCVLASGLQTGEVRHSSDKPKDKVADQLLEESTQP